MSTLSTIKRDVFTPHIHTELQQNQSVGHSPGLTANVELSGKIKSVKITTTSSQAKKIGERNSSNHHFFKQRKNTNKAILTALSHNTDLLNTLGLGRKSDKKIHTNRLPLDQVQAFHSRPIILAAAFRQNSQKKYKHDQCYGPAI